MEVWNAIVLKEPIKKTYWSNCIIEAVKAKMNNDKVRFIMIWPWQNEVWCPHLMWTDGEYEYDFHAWNVPMLGWLWHRGSIRTKPLGWAKSYVDGRRSLRQKRKLRHNTKR